MSYNIYDEINDYLYDEDNIIHSIEEAESLINYILDVHKKLVYKKLQIKGY